MSSIFSAFSREPKDIQLQHGLCGKIFGLYFIDVRLSQNCTFSVLHCNILIIKNGGLSIYHLQDNSKDFDYSTAFNINGWKCVLNSGIPFFQI